MSPGQSRAVPFVLAEQLEGGGGRPVLQRRLLEVLDAVQARRQPVAGGDHLARDFGVAALVGFDQLAIVETAEPDENASRVISNQRIGVSTCGSFDDQGGDDGAAFGHQDVVGAAGGGRVHDLDADAGLDQRSAAVCGGGKRWRLPVPSSSTSPVSGPASAAR